MFTILLRPNLCLPYPLLRLPPLLPPSFPPPYGIEHLTTHILGFLRISIRQCPLPSYRKRGNMRELWQLSQVCYGGVAGIRTQDKWRLLPQFPFFYSYPSQTSLSNGHLQARLIFNFNRINQSEQQATSHTRLCGRTCHTTAANKAEHLTETKTNRKKQWSNLLMPL